GAAKRSAWRILLGAAALLAAVLLAAVVVLSPAHRPAYVIGAKNFTEQYILAQLIGQRLEQGGHTAMQRTGLGSAIIFRALSQGDIDVYVDYSGTIWTNVMGRTDQPPRAEMLQEIGAWLQREHGVRLVGALGFENAYALAMQRDRAAALGITSIADLAIH